MHLHLQSDLHLEHLGPEGLPASATTRDVTVLAGDIHTGTRAADYVLANLRHADVLMVLGNHEFYGGTLHGVVDAWRKAETDINRQAAELGLRGRLSLLEDAVVQKGSVRFLGTTLWSDFFGGHPEAMRAAAASLSDYRCIRRWDDEAKLVEPIDLLWQHKQSLAWLSKMLAQPWPGPTVVITHHLPAAGSVHDRWRTGVLGAQGNILNGGFYTDLEVLMLTHKPALWVHGHTHDSCDYLVGKTRVVCNPRGYPQHPNAAYRADLLLEVG